MQVEYKRNLQNNYLVIEAEEEPEENYCLHMAENNKIPGLLSFHSTRMDGKLFIQYEITSREPMDQIYKKKILSGNQLIGILTEIYDLLEKIQEYLLNPIQILFDPQYIFIGAEDRTLQFCYLPGKEQKETIQILAEFILKHLDHEDLQAVEMGYLFYQCVQEENFSLKQVLKQLLHKEKRMISDKDYADIGKREKKENVINTEKKAEFQKQYDADPYGERTEIKEDIYDVYKVTHKERKREQKKEQGKRKIDVIFQVIHLAVLISALLLIVMIELLYYFQIISLTEAGGMFFLMISVEMMGNQLWKKRKERKEEHEFRWISEEEDAMYRILQEEMYDEDPGETRYLGEQKQESELHLIPVAGKESANRGTVHPEIVMRSEPLLIGKRKGESDIILDSPTVSRTHAILERKGSMYYLCDLNSKNGTFCNGERLLPQEKHNIVQDDRIAFAELEYRAVIYSSAESV